jgi:hypothetical protein
MHDLAVWDAVMKGRFYAILDASPGWRNWQTRRTQNPVGATPCRFDSYARHQVPCCYSVYSRSLKADFHFISLHFFAQPP